MLACVMVTVPASEMIRRTIMANQDDPRMPAILDDAELRGLRELATEYGMAALVEAHTAGELNRALRSGARIVGINNRDLNTFRVSLDTSITLAKDIPSDVIRISESGIFSSNDIHRLMDAGFNAFLVGEHLVKSGNAATAGTCACTAPIPARPKSAQHATVRKMECFMSPPRGLQPKTWADG